MKFISPSIWNIFVKSLQWQQRAAADFLSGLFPPPPPKHSFAQRAHKKDICQDGDNVQSRGKEGKEEGG